MFLVYIIPFAGHFFSMPLHTSSDELGGIAGAAYLAGLNWDDVIKSCGYYGFGYYSLFFWLFKLTDNPIIIYRVIAAFNVLLKAAIVPLSFYIAKRYLKITSEKVLFGVSCLMPFLRLYTTGVIVNEYPLEFLFWVIILLSCKCIEFQNNNKYLFFYMFILLFSCEYGLLLHTRALTILIAVVIVIAGYNLLKKRYYISLCSIFLPVFSYFLLKKIISAYQFTIWGNSGGNVTNGSVSFSGSINLLDPITWVTWFHMLIGMLNTESLVTAGIFIVCVVTVIWYFIRIFKVKFKQGNVYCNLIFLISVLCVGATIFAFLVSDWFNSMYTTWNTKDMGTAYGYKALTYVRYWNVYLPPIVLCVLAILQQAKQKEVKFVISISVIVLLMLQVCYGYYIIPLIKNNSDAASVFFPLTRSFWGDTIDACYYYRVILISLGSSILMYFFSQLKKSYLSIVILLFFLIYQHIGETCYYDNLVQAKMSEKILSTYEEVCKLEHNGVDIGQIYLHDETNASNNWKIYYIAQFYLNRYTLHISIPNKVQKNDIIISVGKSEEIEKQYPDLQKYILDDDEVWYTYLDINALE